MGQDQINEKIAPFGSFSSAITLLEMTSKNLEHLWEEGQIRLTNDDIDRLSEMVNRSYGFLRSIKAEREKFLEIAVRTTVIK
jgi:hypothetical protein